jgi:hypothetical protein
MHAIPELPDGLSAQALLTRAEDRSLGLHGLEPDRHGVYAGPEALVVGYGTPSDHASSAVDVLASS